MSHTVSLHTYVHTRFRESFGKPYTTMGKDDHWRLQGSTSESAINLLLNGTRDIPALWIFDAGDGGDGVFSTSITREDQVDGIIKQIQARMQRADGEQPAL